MLNYWYLYSYAKCAAQAQHIWHMSTHARHLTYLMVSEVTVTKINER